MRIATWNVDGLRARRTELLHWLRKNQPDVMGLQEIKTDDRRFLDGFRADLRTENYHAEFHAQPRCNGVAILSKCPLETPRKGLSGQEDLGARLLTAKAGELSFTTLCVPYKGGRSGPKLPWLDSLSEYLRELEDSGARVVLCGDFNIAPEPIDNGVYEPSGPPSKSRPGYREEEQRRIRSLYAAGWFDLLRCSKGSEAMFTWWNSWDLYVEQRGLRYDLVFGNQAVKDKVEDVWIDCSRYEGVRRGKRPDHAPVIVDLS